MSIGFKEIDDSIAILKYKRSFKQAKCYEREGVVYARDGGGFVKLAVNGSTTNCDIKWVELEGVGTKAPKPMTTGYVGIK